MEQSPRAFGERVAGIAYTMRPGGYAIVVADDGRLAVASTANAWYLPGGGQEDGESAAEAAVREAVEECGLRIAIVRAVAVADEFVHARAEGRYFQKRCSFFLARPLGTCAPSEADHALVWTTPGEALDRLAFTSQRWAVRQAVRS